MDRSIRGYQCLVMLALVGMAWLLPGIAGAVAGAPEKLQVLVNDTAAQLQLAYRQHPDERARRQEQLATAVAAWRAAPRSDANNERLANWLRAAIVSSMPGSTESLPAVPSFVVTAKIEPQAEAHEARAAENSIEKKPSAEVVAKPSREREDDPFRDDP